MNPFVANFRDVGEVINVLAGQDLMREGVLFRGGKLSDVEDLEVIGKPRTIVNLRKGKDREYPGVRGVYAPAPDSVEVYDITQGRNKKWIAEVLGELFAQEECLPCYIHCAAGKDRTGVVVAAVLSICGIDPALIEEEYLLSVGGLQPKLIREAIEALQDGRLYRKVDTLRIRTLLVVGG